MRTVGAAKGSSAGEVETSEQIGSGHVSEIFVPNEHRENISPVRFDADDARDLACRFSVLSRMLSRAKLVM